MQKELWLNVKIPAQVKQAVKARAAVCGASVPETVARLLIKALESEQSVPTKGAK